MRSFIFSFLMLFFMLLHGPVSMQAQIFKDDRPKDNRENNTFTFGNEKGGPPAPPNDARGAGGGPVGGNTPVGGGWLLLVALGAGYGGVKGFRASKNNH